MKKKFISINLIFLLAVSMSLFCFAPVAYADKTINEVHRNSQKQIETHRNSKNLIETHKN